jgi:MFS family permease
LRCPVPTSRRQQLSVLLLLGVSFMLSVDFSILNVALPQVGTAVGLGLSTLPWVATAYALPAAGFMLPFGRIADLFGRRRLFLIGIALMAVSSIVGGSATSPALLLVARAECLATAIAMPAALSLLTTSFSGFTPRMPSFRNGCGTSPSGARAHATRW